jgi:endonuclease/exonuclease/phosphatase family metal-dependent hydrolase
VVVAGDLNSPDRAPDYRALVARGGLIDAMRAEWAAPTSVGKWMPLLVRIDHVLVSAGWCGDGARRFPLPGSDHAGITVSIGPCAGR